jgi:hypothetical protein
MTKSFARYVRFARFVFVAAVLLTATTLLADDEFPAGSMLHEYVPPDPKEDVNLAATTLDGDLPAALDTPSGLATAPDPSRAPDSKNLYAGGTMDDSPESTYEPDRDTRQPEVENYEDPFSPSTSPFKRLRAYDTVDPDYTLRVQNHGQLSVVTVGGELGDSDEPFYADFSIDLVPGEPVRIPTVGPGSRVLKMHTTPETSVTILRDHADNWFMQGSERRRVRVVMEIGIERAIFGSPIADVPWSAIENDVPPQPPQHKVLADQVLEHIGVSRAMSVPAAVAKLVEYFRGFEPSNDPPKEHGDVYLDLALSKKGVCRHRAFAFFVTALNLGIPTRMVVNEAHAWVEVYDGRIWHRIDLGGAALNLDNPPDASKPMYTPPEDPFEWPDGSNTNSGQDLASRMRKNAGISDAPQNGSSDPNGSSVPPAPSARPSTPNDDRPAAHVEIEPVEKAVRRGASFRVRGKIEASEGCANVRVDVKLKSEQHPNPIPIGSLATDESGAYDGSVIIPRDLGVDDYEVIVTTPGDKRCGPGASE